ncbi:rhomboid family intramembrane serine protease [Fluviicola taffensis]|nr:rhomboid family intramembrane serine protease [Fluviicola taffensis]
MFSNIQPVTKNLLLLNVAMFLLTLFFEYQGNSIDLGNTLGAHYFGTALFEPYQLVTHFFMHGGFFHILMNMYILVMFGSFLERLWGPKRFFVLYLASAFGAILLYNGVGFFQIIDLKNAINNSDAIAALNGLLKETHGHITDQNLMEIAQRYGISTQTQYDAFADYAIKSMVPMVGASGAIFGLLAAFAILFPNTELMLIFPPIPIKAKWLIGGYFVFEVYSSFQNSQGDNVAHLAHVGGAIVGAILVLIWRRNSKNFY